MTTATETEQVYYVDLPTDANATDPEASWQNIDSFETEAEALAFAQKHYGADDKGRICIVSPDPDNAATPATTQEQPRCGVANPGGIPCSKPKGHSARGDVTHDPAAYGRSAAQEQHTATQHSPLPWSVSEYEFIHSGIDYVADLNYSELPKEVRRANAHFIVKAVNSFDKLVAALRNARQALADPNRGPSGNKPAIAAIDAALAEVQDAN